MKFIVVYMLLLFIVVFISDWVEIQTRGYKKNNKRR